MPPVKKYKKEDIVEIAYQLIKEEGMKSVNARKVANKLGCSVQPIFHNFTTMEELLDECYQKIYAKYQEYMMREEKNKNAYKQMGLSYIEFASDYPEFFKILFMRETMLDAEKFLMADAVGDHLIKAGQKLSGLSYEEQKKFHIKVGIFTHGIACLVATKTIQFSKEEIEELLTNTVLEMLQGYRKNKEKKK